MEATLTIKDELIDIISTADEKLLRMMHAIAKEYNAEDDFVLSEDDIKELDRRINNYLKGEEKSYTWEEAKAIITGKTTSNEL